MSGTDGGRRAPGASKASGVATRESEDRFRLVVETMREVFWLRDGKTRRFLYLSANYESIWGRPAEEAVAGSLSFLEDVHPEDRDRVALARSALYGEARPFDLEYRVTRPDGAVRWVRARSYPVLDEAGEVSSFSGIAEDVTDRKLAEEALRRSEAWHRILFEGSRDALMTLEPPSWKFTSGNPATIAMLAARDEADFVSRTPWEYSPEMQPDGRDSSSKALEMIETAMREGSHEFEWMHRRLSGEDFPATVLLTRLDIDGRSLMQATVRDETEKRKLMATLAQSDRLASMGMLAAGVAHEINNPLSYVLYNVESLVQDLQPLTGEPIGSPEPPVLADMLSRAREALQGMRRIETITRTLGNFSRVEKVSLSAVDVNLVVGSAINMTWNQIRYRASLDRDLGRIPAVLASEGKLTQVFLNLLVNAAQSIEEGDVGGNRISVRTWTDGGLVLAEVADTGKGIPPGDVEHIFEPFFTTKPVGVGSGIGLAMCRSILAELGGDIGVESEVGVGSRFLVRLPALEGVPEARNDAAAGKDAPRSQASRGRILVVDDEEQIRKMLARLLGRDHEVVASASGGQAMALLEKDRSFDVVLCDLMMPETTGMDLHAWLADRDPALAGRVVFMSGGAFTPGASHYLAGVGNPRVDKPFDTAGLLGLVAGMVEAAKGRQG